MIFDKYIKPEYIEEGKAERNALASNVTKLYQHMLKWQYHKDKQTPSWANSILDAYNDICNVGASYWNRIDINECFVNARKAAIKEEGKSFSMVYPEYLPIDWNCNNITNKQFIAKYLRIHYSPTYNFDLNKMIYNKLRL